MRASVCAAVPCVYQPVHLGKDNLQQSGGAGLPSRTCGVRGVRGGAFEVSNLPRDQGTGYASVRSNDRRGVRGNP